MRENDLARIVVDVAYYIHRELGPGLLESVYHAVMFHELTKRKLQVTSQSQVPVVWDGVSIEVGFRADLIVEGILLIELKSVEQAAAVHRKQLLTYLRLTNCRLVRVSRFLLAELT